jgi:hypothetical protein
MTESVNVANEFKILLGSLHFTLLAATALLSGPTAKFPVPVPSVIPWVMKTYGRSGGIAPLFLTWELHGDEHSTSYRSV